MKTIQDKRRERIGRGNLGDFVFGTVERSTKVTHDGVRYVDQAALADARYRCNRQLMAQMERAGVGLG